VPTLLLTEHECAAGHKILEQMIMFLLETLKRKEDNYGSGMEGNWNLLRGL
jgi:hypothetical protein